jgi:uncharacterized membrane protein YgcG
VWEQAAIITHAMDVNNQTHPESDTLPINTPSWAAFPGPLALAFNMLLTVASDAMVVTAHFRAGIFLATAFMLCLFISCFYAHGSFHALATKGSLLGTTSYANGIDGGFALAVSLQMFVLLLGPTASVVGDVFSLMSRHEEGEGAQAGALDGGLRRNRFAYVLQHVSQAHVAPIWMDPQASGSTFVKPGPLSPHRNRALSSDYGGGGFAYRGGGGGGGGGNGGGGDHGGHGSQDFGGLDNKRRGGPAASGSCK